MNSPPVALKQRWELVNGPSKFIVRVVAGPTPDGHWLLEREWLPPGIPRARRFIAISEAALPLVALLQPELIDDDDDPTIDLYPTGDV